MILHPNNKISIYRGASYGTTVDSNIDVYIYELSDELDAIHGVEGGQNEQRLLTVYSGLEIGDKLIDKNSVAFIVKKVKHRESIFLNFYEVQIRQEND